MPLKVLILGSGSALPTISSNQTAQVLSCGNQLYLIDCGEGTQVELRRNKVKMQNINHVFISHLHGDHFFGLVGLLSTMHLLGRKKELNIYGPEGLREIVELQFKNAGSHLSFQMKHHLIVKAGDVLVDDKNLTVKALPLKHRIPCHGFLFEEKIGLRKLKPASLEKYNIPVYARKGIAEGKDFTNEEGELIENNILTTDPFKPKSYAFCSDTAYYEKISEYISKVDLLYHETTFLEKDKDKAKKTFHSTAKDAAKMALKLNASKMIIGHFSNRYAKLEWFLDEARPIFEETYIAEEGKEYIV